MKEHEKAKAWRQSLKLSIATLGAMTGYSYSSIYWFERGLTPPDRHNNAARVIDEQVWQRYRMACAAAHVQLKSGQQFKWGQS